MTTLLYFIFCLLPPLIRHDVAGQETEPTNQTNVFRRFVMEENYKPSIFGSFRYNPILDQFDLPENVRNSTTTSTTTRRTAIATEGITKETDKPPALRAATLYPTDAGTRMGPMRYKNRNPPWKSTT